MSGIDADASAPSDPPDPPDPSDPCGNGGAFTDLAASEALGAAPGKPLSPAARRALEEALARRGQAAAAPQPAEDGGPRGLEPTRFGDWERKGLAVDF